MLRCIHSYSILLPLIFWGQFAPSQQDGLVTNLQQTVDGVVLFAPISSDTTYLIDRTGNIVHKWHCDSYPGLTAYLLPDGTLLRAGHYNNVAFTKYSSRGGLIEKYDWDSHLLWSYVLSDSIQTQNHDVCALPNGNIIAVVWEKISPFEAISQGRKPELLDNELWSAKLIELKPKGKNEADIVWQWRLWNHIVQSADSTKPNYGEVDKHPELINVNYTNTNGQMYTDWIHLNSVAYNPALDQIMVCSRNLSEIYIIDHSTTTTQAAGHAGGKYHKGGDILYRWGNPAAYNKGGKDEQMLFMPHHPTWIEEGCPYANSIMIYNNGVTRPNGQYSSVDIISPAIDKHGNYLIDTGGKFGPVTLTWSYCAPVPEDFFSRTMGSVQALSNGNIMYCDANKGKIVEVDSQKKIVWSYTNTNGTSVSDFSGVKAAGNDCARAILYPMDYDGLKGTLFPAKKNRHNRKHFLSQVK